MEKRISNLIDLIYKLELRLRSLGKKILFMDETTQAAVEAAEEKINGAVEELAEALTPDAPETSSETPEVAPEITQDIPAVDQGAPVETPVTEEAPAEATVETPVTEEAPASVEPDVFFEGKKVTSHSTDTLYYAVQFEDGTEGFAPVALFEGVK
jgi:hypothetical protein